MTAENEMMRLLERADPVRDHSAAPMVDAAQYLEQLTVRDRVVPAVDFAEVEEERAHEKVVDTEPSPNKQGAHRRWLIGATAAVVAAAIAVAASLVVEGNNNGVVTNVPSAPSTESTRPAPTTTTTPLPMVAPAERLPAEGAPLSTPETGELVAAAAHIHRGSFFLYADGRLISIWDTDYPIRSWVERRLSAAGVEAVRQEFLSTGAFDPGQAATEVPAGDMPPSRCMCVRSDDGRMLARTDLERGLEPTAVESELEAVLTYFEELESKIPEAGWVDREFKDYAPAKYSIDFTRENGTTSERMDPNDARALLSEPAATLLDGQELRFLSWSMVLDGDTRYFNRSESGKASFVVTSDVARALAAQFPEALTERFAGGTYGFSWAVAGSEPEPAFLTFWLWPLLPHGDIAMWGG
jgi:hypothetical protein